MSAPIEYGVFRVGQYWRVVGEGHNELGFPTLERALAAAKLIVAAHQVQGKVASVVLLDDSGRLVDAETLGNSPGDGVH